MNRIYRAILLPLIGLVLSCAIHAADSEQLVQEAWKSWAKNDQAAVEAKFREAIAKDPGNHRAYVGLAYLYGLQGKEADAWETFKHILETADNPYPYLFSAWSMVRQMHNQDRIEPDVVGFWEKLAEKADEGGVLRAMANQFLGGYFEKRGALEKSHQYYRAINAIDQWMLSGPYDNISASGFDKVFPPEREYKPGKVYEGQNGVPAKWFPIAGVRADYWIDFQRYFAQSDAVFYGNNFIYAPQDLAVQIRIGTSGSLKAFLNDELMIEYFDENNNDLDTYIVETELKKGWNRLLIKVGFSEIDRANFMVRITDAQGDPVDGLQISTAPQSYPVKPGNSFRAIPNFAERFFQQQIEAQPDHLENYALLADCYLRNDKAIEGELVLRDALKLSPNCALFHYRLIEAYSRGEKYDEIATTWERLHNLDPQIPEVLTYRFYRFVENEQMEEAEAALNRLGELRPESREWFAAALNFYSQKRQVEKIIEISRQAYEKYPDSWDFAYMEATIAIQTTRSYQRAIEIYQDQLQKNYDATILATLAEAYLQDSNVPAWEETYQKMLALDPSAPGYYFQMARTYAALQNYDAAQQMLRKAIEICPNNSAYWAKLGEVLRASGAADQAREAYREALAYQPTNYEARDILRELEGKKSVFSYFPEANIGELVKASPDAAAYPQDDALIVYHDLKRVVYHLGASESAEELLVKVFNSRGIDAFKEYYIGVIAYNEGLNVEKAVVIKKDGSEVKADIDRNHVVFKSLEEGEHIYLKWKIKNYYSGKLSNQFWDQFYFNSFYPVKDIRYSLLVPEDFQFEYRTQRMELKPSRQKTPDGLLYQWRLSDEPAMVYEYGMPVAEDVSKILHISSIRDWPYMVDWYADIAQTKTRSSYEIREQVAALFAGKPESSEAEKIRTIYNFITENIRYSSVSFRQSGLIPQEARDVLVNKIGDCKDVATLCIAMLREVGITAHYVLVNTRDEGLNEHILPSIDFNHCIAGVETRRGLQYLDLTANNYPYGALPNMDLGSFSLLIKPGVTAPAYIQVDQTPGRNLERKLTATIGQDNSLTLEKSGVRSGSLAASFRANYRDQPPATREKSLLETLAREYPDVKLLHFEIENLEDLNQPVRYRYDFVIPGYLSGVGDFKFMKIPWTDALENNKALSYETRQYPYYYWPAADTVREESEILLPPGYVPAELGEDAVLNCAIASYTLRLKYDNGRIFARRELINHKAVVSPEEYPEFKKFYNAVIQADSRQILLKAAEQN